MKKVKRYAGMQGSQVSLDDGEGAPIAFANSGAGNPMVGSGAPVPRQSFNIAPGDFPPAPAIDFGQTPERARFDADITRAMSGERGLAPQAASNRLNARGVDVSAMLPKIGQKAGGAVKKMASGGKTSKVSSASKRADGIAQRGKTRGRYL